ncbi:Pyrroline-5-carboxylate reductase [uncultured Desulfobacterium sp.]|uniref:Pyrroline-5-carboxylate reductase n=1 Tax=uncultured Desulfobacterium sp. TaxID=201089 RepID=A0A445N391_9BACT|nr:Pyrroline-5-carboxylate reductase [uncultured Desulfobacterium sp.]
MVLSNHTSKGVLTMTERQKIGFIGAGNMATALIKGLLNSGVYDREQILASDKVDAAVKKVSEQFGLTCCASNGELMQRCSIVVLSVKPQNLRDVLEEIKGEVRDDHLLISIAAGIPLSMIQQIIGKDIALIRVMPNTPALVQKGVSALAAGKWAGPDHLALAREIFNSVGKTVDVNEQMMDAVTAVSGSGPGYVFRIMECMVDAGVAVGLEGKAALDLVVETFLGAACLARESGQSLASLREMVTSPGGTTAEGLAAFDKLGLADMTIKAVQAACRRSIELGKNY